MAWAICKPPPDNCTVCMLAGLSSALSVTVSVPASVPALKGVNSTATRHCAPEARSVLEVQSVPPEGTTVKFAEAATFDTLKVWLPASETVTVCGALVEPTGVLAKVKADSERLSSYTLPAAVTYTLADESRARLCGLVTPAVARTACEAPPGATRTILELPESAT